MFSHICAWQFTGLDAIYPVKFLFSLPGVAIFFVISGFLVTDSYVRASSTGLYFIKRGLRIYPALIVNIAVMELAILATGSSQLLSSIKSVSYMAIYMLTGSQYWAINLVGFDTYIPTGFYKASYPSGVLWTITVELTFYLILPLLLEIWRRWNRAGAVLIVVAAVVSWVLSRHYNLTDKYDVFVSTTIGPNFWIFSLGMLARLYWDRVRVLFENKAVWWFGVHLVFTLATMPYLPLGSVTPATPVDGLRVIVLAGLVLSLAYSFPLPDLLKGRDISYGIYLYHMLVIHTLVGLGFIWLWWLWFVGPALTIVLAALSWRFIEKPALRWRKSIAAPKLEAAVT